MGCPLIDFGFVDAPTTAIDFGSSNLERSKPGMEFFTSTLTAISFVESPN